MKRAILVLFCVVALCILLVSPVAASGDKVRGENGQGDVNQVQIMDPPPFQP